VYEVYLEHSVERDLKRLPAEEFHRIISHITDLAENPRPAGCRKIMGSKNDWRIRVGSFRIIYEIDEKVKAVNVMKIRYRREAYR
jgi:mRNA interferase RelE/StbE